LNRFLDRARNDPLRVKETLSNGAGRVKKRQIEFSTGEPSVANRECRIMKRKMVCNAHPTFSKLMRGKQPPTVTGANNLDSCFRGNDNVAPSAALRASAFSGQALLRPRFTDYTGFQIPVVVRADPYDAPPRAFLPAPPCFLARARTGVTQAQVRKQEWGLRSG